MTMLAVLRHEEGIRVDAERLVTMYTGRTKLEAEAVLLRGIEDMASRVDEIRRHFDNGDGFAIVRCTRFAARMAEPMGMISFIAVARDLIASTEANDRPAQAATLARLLRVANRSLSAICDLRDMTV